MAYSAEVVARARARLAQAKEDRESENRQHLAEAYARVPRIREIDMELRRTMAQAAQAAFTQGGDPAELLEQARRENLLLQQERELPQNNATNILVGFRFWTAFAAAERLAFHWRKKPLPTTIIKM